MVRRISFATRSHRAAARRLCRIAARPGIDCDGELPARLERLKETESARPRRLGKFGDWRAYLEARRNARAV